VLYTYTVPLMSKDFKVQRLSEELGQYLLVIKCAACVHERRAHPNLLESWWTALTLRCSRRARAYAAGGACDQCGFHRLVVSGHGVQL